MARKLEVEIVGDSRKLEQSFRRSAQSARRFNQQATTAGRTRGVFGGLTRSVTGLAASLVGGIGLAGAARAAFGEMADAQKVAAQTQAALKSTGGAANVSAEQIDALATTLMNLSGTDDEVIKSGENLLLTFTNIRNEVGKNNDIFDQATRAALDMSVALGQDMKSSAIQLGKALNDPVKGITALRRVGVSFDASQIKLIKHLVATGHTLEAQKLILREVQKEFGGSAKAAGQTLPGKLNILRENVLNLAGAFAEQLSPSIEKLIDRATKWIQNTDNQKRLMNDVKQVAGAVTDVFDRLKRIMDGLNSITGSTKNTLKILFGVFVAFKTARLVATFADIASNIGLVGTKADKTTGQLGKMKGVLGGLTAAAWLITLEVAIKDVQDPGSIKRRAEKIWGALTGPLKNVAGGIPVIGPIVQAAVDANNRLKKSADATKGSLDALSVSVDQVKTKLTGMTTAAIHADAALQRAQKSAFAQSQSLRERGLLKPPGAGAGAGGKGKFKFGGSFLDLLQLRVDQAALTKPLRDDLAAARRLQSYIEKLIKRYGHTYKLEQQLLRAKQQVNGILDQQKSLDEDELQKRRDAAERAQEKVKAAREAAAALREERQQRFLETGSPFVPNVKKLKDQLAQVRKALGSAIDPATRTKLNRIAKILAGAFGTVGKAMREQLKSELDGLRKDLDTGTTHIARVVGVNAGKIAAGLGLTPQQRKALTARLSEIGPHMTVPGRRSAASAAALGGVVITGDVHFHGVQNLRDLEEQVVKRHKGRAHTRRGA